MTRLTIAQVKQIAMQNYEDGGHVVIECWDDFQIQEWINDDNDIEDLYTLFNIYCG